MVLVLLTLPSVVILLTLVLLLVIVLTVPPPSTVRRGAWIGPIQLSLVISVLEVVMTLSLVILLTPVILVALLLRSSTSTAAASSSTTHWVEGAPFHPEKESPALRRGA